jgi:hypothetical protein
MLLMFIVVLFLSSTSICAQYVEIVRVDNQPHYAIKSSKGLSVYTTVKKDRSMNYLSTDAANEKNYHFFAVSNKEQVRTQYWSAIFDACDPGWRVPTQRELMLISILEPEFKGIDENLFDEFEQRIYWSATGSAKGAYVLNFQTNTMLIVPPERHLMLRCIKDL